MDETGSAEQDAREALRALRRQPQSDERAPVLAYQRDVGEIERFHPMPDPRDLSRVAVVAALARLVRLADVHADVGPREQGADPAAPGVEDRHVGAAARPEPLASVTFLALF